MLEGWQCGWDNPCLDPLLREMETELCHGARSPLAGRDWGHGVSCGGWQPCHLPLSPGHTFAEAQAAKQEDWVGGHLSSPSWSLLRAECFPSLSLGQESALSVPPAAPHPLQPARPLQAVWDRHVGQWLHPCCRVLWPPPRVRELPLRGAGGRVFS